MTDLEGLQNLTSLRTVYITGSNLTSLEHLHSLSSAANPALARVDAFAALTDPIVSLSVYQNASLPLCQAEAIAQRAQTACSCPSHTVSTCTTTCQGLDYCACDGVCNC